MKMATEYGERLLAAMAHAKINQKELVKRTGVKQSTISSAINRGKGSSDTPAYASACGVSALWLATGEGTMLDAPTAAYMEDGHYVIRGSPRAPDPGWPFDKVERDQYLALPQDSQALVQAQFQEAITKEITRLYLKQGAPVKNEVTADTQKTIVGKVLAQQLTTESSAFQPGRTKV